MSRVCEACGSLLEGEVRSAEISTRWNAHITWLARKLTLPRDQVYFEVLLKALEIECDAGEPYPYVTVARWITSPITGVQTLHDLPEPLSTRNRTNRQMMVACEAANIYAAERGLILPESIDRIIREFEEQA